MAIQSRAKLAVNTPTSRVVRCANTAESAKKNGGEERGNHAERRPSGGRRPMSRRTAGISLTARMVYLPCAAAMPSDPHHFSKNTSGSASSSTRRKKSSRRSWQRRGCPRGDADRRRQIALLPTPALIMDGVTVVVSPLIALMKDQVDALERRGIAATLINSSLSLAEQQARIRSLAAGELQARLHRPGAVSQPVVPGRVGAGDDLALRHRRGALHLAVGTRFPAGLLPAGHGHRAARPSPGRGVHRDRDAGGAAGHPRAAQLAGTEGVRRRFRPSEPAPERASGGTRGRQVRPAAGAHRRAENRHHLLRDPQAGRSRARQPPGPGRQGHRLPRRPQRRGARAGAGPIHQPPIRRGRGHQRLRHGHRPVGHPVRRAFRGARQPGGLLPGSRPRRARRRAVRLRVVFQLRRHPRAGFFHRGQQSQPPGDPGNLPGVAQRGRRPGRGRAAHPGHRRAAHDGGRREQRHGRQRRPERAAPGGLHRPVRPARPAHARHADHPSADQAARTATGLGRAGRKERRDRSKLKTVVEFVYARACRQETLLRYFGEKEPERCGNCDICSDHARYGRRLRDGRGSAHRAQGAQRRRAHEPPHGRGLAGAVRQRQDRASACSAAGRARCSTRGSIS